MKIEVTERKRSALANHTQKQNTRSEVKRLQQWHQPFSLLRAQMTVKASKDPNYITFKDELVHLLQQQSAFLEELLRLSFISSFFAGGCHFVIVVVIIVLTLVLSKTWWLLSYDRCCFFTVLTLVLRKPCFWH